MLLRYVVSELLLDFFALDFERRTINVAVWAHNVLLLKLLETILPRLIHLNNYTDQIVKGFWGFGEWELRGLRESRE